MLTVWGRASSSNVQALMWCIGELGLPYKRIDVGHCYGGTDTEAFGAMNPNRTVPVLRDGDGPPLWETASVLRYLATRYGDGAFWPRDLAARTEIDMWAEWSKLNVAMAFTAPVFWRVVRTAPHARDQAAIVSAVAGLEAKLALAEHRLQRHRYLVGDALTLADIQFAHVLYRYFELSIERAALPALASYYQSMTRRPAFVEHVMLSYEELRVE